MWLNILALTLPIFSSLVDLMALTSFNNIDQQPLLHSGLSGYTDIQQIALKQFRALVGDIVAENDFYKSDNYLMRWLQARNFNVSAAHQMIRQAKQWRVDNHVDTILSEDISIGVKPFALEGFDKEGRPVISMSSTKNDLRKLIIRGKRESLLRIFDQMMELGFSNAIRSTASDGQFNVILDFEGINVRQHLCIQCMAVHLKHVYNYENYYPSSIKYFVMINVNNIATTLLEFLRPVFSQTTRNAVRVFGTSKQEWSAFLLSIIDADQLPTRLGGTKT